MRGVAGGGVTGQRGGELGEPNSRAWDGAVTGGGISGCFRNKFRQGTDKKNRVRVKGSTWTKGKNRHKTSRDRNGRRHETNSHTKLIMKFYSNGWEKVKRFPGKS